MDRRYFNIHILGLFLGFTKLTKATQSNNNVVSCLDISRNVDIKEMGAKGDGITDDTKVFRLAIKNFNNIHIPFSNNPYVITAALELPKGVKIYSKSIVRPKLLFSGDIKVCIYMHDNTVIDNLEIDGGFSGVIGGSVVIQMQGKKSKVLNSVIVKGGVYNILMQCKEGRVSNCSVMNSHGTGIALRSENCRYNNLNDITIKNNHGFGIWVTDKASFNIIKDNKCKDNRLEFCGITYDAHHNLVGGNTIVGSGDNAISVTGYGNIIEKNCCESSNYHGIGVYGEANIILQNKCENNGQHNLLRNKNLNYSGIALVPNFGGFARFNIVIDNICSETQIIKTQIYGIKLERSQYKSWNRGKIVKANLRYAANDGNVYYAEGHLNEESVTGSVEPTHNHGSCSDGAIIWKWIGSFDKGLDGDYHLQRLKNIFRDMRFYHLNKPVSNMVDILVSCVSSLNKTQFSDRNTSECNVERCSIDATCNYLIGNDCRGNYVKDVGVMSRNINHVKNIR
ncbi:MAG: right-handed parallel beta-helix repeat-containing protein [Candidatus Thiodiazotropha sp.]